MSEQSSAGPLPEIIQGQLLTSAPQVTRITQFRIGRMHNLGNYEHIKYEVTVEVAEGDDVGKRLTTVENILNDLQANLPHSDWDIRRAKALLAKPEADLDEYELKQLPQSKQKIADNEAVMQRREAARAALSTLNYEAIHTDAKKDWDDDGDDDYAPSGYESHIDDSTGDDDPF